jgi:hypothetical protein
MTQSANRMPQRTITIPKYLETLLIKYAAETNQSISGVIVQCAEIGLFQKLGDINKAAVFLSMEGKRQEQRVNLQEPEQD